MNHLFALDQIISSITIYCLVFANGLGDLNSILGRLISKTQKMLHDTSLFNTQQYKVRIKSKVEQSRKRRSALPNNPRVVAIEKGAFWSPSTTLLTFTYRFNISI